VKVGGKQKMEDAGSSETSVGFQWTTQHYVPEELFRTAQDCGIQEDSIYSHCCPYVVSGILQEKYKTDDQFSSWFSLLI
jgi:hypothetical protein